MWFTIKAAILIGLKKMKTEKKWNYWNLFSAKVFYRNVKSKKYGVYSIINTLEELLKNYIPVINSELEFEIVNQIE